MYTSPSDDEIRTLLKQAKSIAVMYRLLLS